MRKTALATIFALLVIASCTKKSTPTATAEVSGPKVFSENCARCHGETGYKDKDAPDLRSIALDKAGMVNIITNGKSTPGRKLHMPSFKNKLSDAQISAAADLILSWRKK